VRIYQALLPSSAAYHNFLGPPHAAGQIFHAAGPSADGWTIVGIHDSKESWEKFRDEILLPRLKAGVKGGFTVPPQETTFPIYNLQTAQS
jgi:hypothetical protein